MPVDCSKASQGACAPVRPRSAPQLGRGSGAGEYPNNSFSSLPRMCNHCTKPACLEACPNEAIYKREQDGIVVIHQDKCKGAQACVSLALPTPNPYFNPLTNKANKCIGCFPRIEQRHGNRPTLLNVWVVPCTSALSTMSTVLCTSSSRQYKVALPLHPEFGTEPNVFPMCRLYLGAH